MKGHLQKLLFTLLLTSFIGHSHNFNNSRSNEIQNKEHIPLNGLVKVCLHKYKRTESYNSTSPISYVKIKNPIKHVYNSKVFNWKHSDNLLTKTESLAISVIPRIKNHNPYPSYKDKNTNCTPSGLIKIEKKINKKDNEHKTIPYWKDSDLNDQIKKFLGVYSKTNLNDNSIPLIDKVLTGSWREGHYKKDIHKLKLELKHSSIRTHIKHSHKTFKKLIKIEKTKNSSEVKSMFNTKKSDYGNNSNKTTSVVTTNDINRKVNHKTLEQNYINYPLQGELKQLEWKINKVKKILFKNISQDTIKDGWIKKSKLKTSDNSPKTDALKTCNAPWSDRRTYINNGMKKQCIYRKTVDISCTPSSIKIFADVRGGDGLDDQRNKRYADSISFSYRKNGGEKIRFKLINDKQDKFNWTTISSPEIKGNKIEIIIESYTTNLSEKYKIKNIRVEQATKAKKTCNDDFPWAEHKTTINGSFKEPVDYIKKINISCASDIYLLGDIVGTGGLDSKDILKIDYKVDAGQWVTVYKPSITQNFEKNISSKIPNGKEVSIRIRASVSHSSENIKINNLRLDKTSTLKNANRKSRIADNIQNSKISIYPNPVNDKLNLNVTTETYNVYLINIFGKTVLNRTHLHGKNTINVKRFNAGVYFVRINTRTKQTVKKIIIM